MSFANNISGKNRKRKFDYFINNFAITPQSTILDVGYNNTEYSPYDNYLERHYPYQQNITALGLVEPKEFAERYPKVKAIAYDGNIFPFPDKSFDICWSNAVIEHVGQRDKQIFFLQEIKRVSHKAYISTPNRFFPIEVHTRTPFIHYLPKKYFDMFLRQTGKAWAADDYMYLLGINDIQKYLKSAGIKNYSITRNKLAGFTIDFSISMNFD